MNVDSSGNPLGLWVPAQLVDILREALEALEVVLENVAADRDLADPYDREILAAVSRSWRGVEEVHALIGARAEGWRSMMVEPAGVVAD